MSILLVRHGDAVQGGGDIDDNARWLSPAGRERVRRVAALVAQKGCSFTRFVSSPRVRAVQTAELFAATLGFTGAIEIVPALSFTVPAQRAHKALEQLSGTLAAFGHMPTIAELCELYVDDSVSAFAPGEAVYVEGGKVRFRLTA